MSLNVNSDGKKVRRIPDLIPVGCNGRPNWHLRYRIVYPIFWLAVIPWMRWVCSCPRICVLWGVCLSVCLSVRRCSSTRSRPNTPSTTAVHTTTTRQLSSLFYCLIITQRYTSRYSLGVTTQRYFAAVIIWSGQAPSVSHCRFMLKVLLVDNRILISRPRTQCDFDRQTVTSKYGLLLDGVIRHVTTTSQLTRGSKHVLLA